MKKSYCLLGIIVIIFAAGCYAWWRHQQYSRSKNKEVQQALNLAGNNRNELEKVLEYYSKPADSLKLKAAGFLIANMPGHYSYRKPELIGRYYDEVDSLLDKSGDLSWQETKQCMEAISEKYTMPGVREAVFDLHVITAKYLIDNIDSAFDVWQNGEWATHVRFGDFCEYILPYKGSELQALDNWREYGRDMFKADLDNLHYCDLYKNSAYWACNAVNREMAEILNPRIIPEEISFIPVWRMRTLARISFGACKDYSLLALSVMRSKGIPVAEDFTPQWPFRSLGHTWNVVLANSGKNVVFGGAVSHPGEPHKPDEKMAKVFRQCYSVNKEIKAIHAAGQPVPNTFRNIHIRDVTDEYMETRDVEIEIAPEFRNKFRYAYLAVFDIRGWVPVHWGKVQRQKIIFNKMGKNIIYLPVFATQNGLEAFSEPFLLTAQGKIKPYNVDSSQRQTLMLNRKYYLPQRVHEVGKRMDGGKIQASNFPDFRDSITLHRINGWVVYSGEANLDNADAYRYWRYLSPNSAYCNIAELYFMEKETGKEIIGRIIGTQGAYNNHPVYTREAAFDRDPLTFFDAPQPNNSWVGMDFGEAIEIGKVVYVPRTDGNDVTIGHLYELFYWNKDNWISLGQKQAEDINIIYENVPANTLYWLRDLTTGKEERIFTYENGRQVWW